MFDVPFWQGPAELIHLLSVISPVADDLAVVYLPLLPVGLWELLGELGIELIAVPDEEFPTLGCNVLAVEPGVVILADGNPPHRGQAGPGRLRGPHLPGDRDRAQRVGRSDLPDPADPARAVDLTARTCRPPPVGGRRRRRLDVIDDLADARPDPERHRLRGGGLGALLEMLGMIPGIAVEGLVNGSGDDPADPDWPGEEMPRTALPIVIGRLGRTGGRRIVLVGHSTSCRPATGHVERRPVGRRRSATASCTVAAPAT